MARTKWTVELLHSLFENQLCNRAREPVELNTLAWLAVIIPGYPIGGREGIARCGFQST